MLRTYRNLYENQWDSGSEDDDPLSSSFWSDESTEGEPERYQDDTNLNLDGNDPRGYDSTAARPNESQNNKYSESEGKDGLKTNDCDVKEKDDDNDTACPDSPVSGFSLGGERNDPTCEEDLEFKSEYEEIYDKDSGVTSDKGVYGDMSEKDINEKDVCDTNEMEDHRCEKEDTGWDMSKKDATWNSFEREDIRDTSEEAAWNESEKYNLRDVHKKEGIVRTV